MAEPQPPTEKTALRAAPPPDAINLPGSPIEHNGSEKDTSEPLQGTVKRGASTWSNTNDGEVAKNQELAKNDDNSMFSPFSGSSRLQMPDVRRSISVLADAQKKEQKKNAKKLKKLLSPVTAFYWDMKKADILENNVEVAGYVLSRLEFYMQSLQQEVWLGATTSRISGIWQVLEILKQISFEFESGTEFGIELLRQFEKDLRALMEDTWKELVFKKMVLNYAPWTPEGQQSETDLINYLVAADQNVQDLPHGPKGPHKSISDAMSTLKRMGEPNKDGKYDLGKGKDGQPVIWEEEQVRKMRKEVKKRFLDVASESDWWKQSPYARAFSIGLKDMWEEQNFKALQYIIRQAKKMQNAKPEPNKEKIPFYWVRNIMNLAGPHAVCFLGDSDAFAVFTERLERVRYFTLPRFTYEVLDFESELKTRLRQINAMKLKVLSLITAFLIAFFNTAMKKWADSTS